MDKAKLVQRLMATFLEELEEHVQALNRDLLALEQDPAGEKRADRLKTLFRTAHSLKGGEIYEASEGVTPGKRRGGRKVWRWISRHRLTIKQPYL